jgi:hypothetical protein
MPKKGQRWVNASTRLPAAAASWSQKVEPTVAEALLPRDNWYLLRAILNGSGDLDDAVTALSEPGALTAGF